MEASESTSCFSHALGTPKLPERLKIMLPETKEKYSIMQQCFDLLCILWSVIKIHWIGLKYTILQILSHHNEFQIGQTEILANMGKWAVVTGGERGIGIEVVRKLCQCRMNVIIGCRDTTYGKEVVRQLREDATIKIASTLVVCELDLMSFNSVGKFAKRVIELSNCRIQVLVNNAGVMFPKFSLTEDNLGNQMQTNHLGHFSLIYHLIPALACNTGATDYTRIVNVSSVCHYGSPSTSDRSTGILDVKDNYKVYMDSKFCQISTSIAWNKHFCQAALQIKVLNVHPGVVNTHLYKNVFYHKFILPLMAKICLTPRQGADCIVYAALSPELNTLTPVFLINSQERAPHDGVFDTKTLDTIWKLSCSATGVPTEIPLDLVTN